MSRSQPAVAFSLRLPQRQVDYLRSRAERFGVTIAEYIRRIIDQDQAQHGGESV